MIFEDFFEMILGFMELDQLRIPDNYLSGLSHLLDQLGSLEFILPVSTAFSCIVFILIFSLSCGLVKVVINK